MNSSPAPSPGLPATPTLRLVADAPASERREWVNPLPGWVLDDAEARGVGRTYLATLRAAANAGDRNPADGSIRNILGGARLARRAGVSYRSLQRHLPKLVANGYLVIDRPADPMAATEAKRCHLYRIPASPPITHSPSDARTPRRDDRPRPQAPDPPPPPRPHANLSCTPRHVDVGVTSDCRTSPSPSPSPGDSNHGVSGGVCRPRRARAGRSPWLRGVTDDDLADTARLLDLLDRAIDQGVGGLRRGNDQDRLRFVAMAEHARRVATSPPALFARNVSLAGTQPMVWAYVTEADEQSARQRLRSADTIEPEPEPAPAIDEPEVPEDPALAALSAELAAMPPAAFAAERAAALEASGWSPIVLASLQDAGPTVPGVVAMIARYRAGLSDGTDPGDTT